MAYLVPVQFFWGQGGQGGHVCIQTERFGGGGECVYYTVQPEVLRGIMICVQYSTVTILDMH